MQRYDIKQTYQWNYDHVPDPPVVDVPTVAGTWRFCGMAIDSPIGIPAGPLLNGKWVRYYAALGFDVLTYKTVRSTGRACYPLPNLVPVRESAVETYGQNTHADPTGTGQSWAISFGMPSMPPDVWRADVRETCKQLGDGQRLIVSVVGTADDGGTIDDLAADYARCGAWAAEAGADGIEANFSCPNVATRDGMLYRMPKEAGQVSRTLRQAVGDSPLILKVGCLADRREAESLLTAVHESVDAICLVNSVPARVLDASGTVLFDGALRGVGGPAIRHVCVRQVAMCKDIIMRNGLEVELIGVGGACDADSVRAFLDAGAGIVQMATAAMRDPLVGIRIRRAWANTPNSASANRGTRYR